MNNHCQPALGEIDWHREAKRLLRSELVKRGISIPELSQLLALIEVKESPKSLAVKISRGKFQLAFFLQCMAAIEANTVLLNVSLRSNA